MDDNNSPPSKKSKRQVQQVVKLQLIESYNVIELTYDCKKGRSCKTIGHTQRQFNKLYVIPCIKTFDSPCFKDLFNTISFNKELVVFEKQQYYSNYCHKFCEQCLETVHLECLIHIACPICEAIQDINYFTYTRCIFDMPISKGFKIHNFGQFHDIYVALQTYLKNNLGRSSSTTPSKPSPFSIFQCTFVEKGLMESLILQKFGNKRKYASNDKFFQCP